MTLDMTLGAVHSYCRAESRSAVEHEAPATKTDAERYHERIVAAMDSGAVGGGITALLEPIREPSEDELATRDANHAWYQQYEAARIAENRAGAKRERLERWFTAVINLQRSGFRHRSARDLATTALGYGLVFR